MTNPKKPVDRATATINKPTSTDAQRSSVTATTVTGIQASTNYGSAPSELKTSVTNWSNLGAALAANGKANGDLRSALAAGESKQRKLRVQWTGAKRQVLSNLTVYCDGDIAMMQTFAVDVLHHTVAGSSPADAPANIATHTGAALGSTVVEWARGKDKSWVVQWATDPTNPATCSPLIAWSKRKYTLTGQAPGSHVYFRVAVQDSSVPEGHGAWSAWIAASVR